MFKIKLSYRKRIRLLPIIAITLFFAVYWLAVGETFKLREEIKQMENEARSNQDAPEMLNKIMKRLDQVNEITGNKNGETVTDPLLELSSKQASDNNVILSEYQPAHIFNYGNQQVETRVVSFEAPFVPCLRVLYNMEKYYRYGKVVSVNYFTRTDYKTSKKHLTMQILIQTIKNEKNVSEISE